MSRRIRSHPGITAGTVYVHKSCVLERLTELQAEIAKNWWRPSSCSAGTTEVGRLEQIEELHEEIAKNW